MDQKDLELPEKKADSMKTEFSDASADAGSDSGQRDSTSSGRAIRGDHSGHGEWPGPRRTGVTAENATRRVLHW